MEYGARGGPVATRGEWAWSLVVGVVTVVFQHAFHFESLKMSVLCQQLVLDHLLMKVSLKIYMLCTSNLITL